MNKSNTIKELATALSRAQAEFVPAPFNASNPHLRNKYADLGSIIESTKPILERHGLSVSQMVQGEGNEIGIITILMHASGEWLESSVVMPILEQKGINNAQVAGSIISYLRRYSLAAALGVYAGEDDDAGGYERACHQMSWDAPQLRRQRSVPGSESDKVRNGHEHEPQQTSAENTDAKARSSCFQPTCRTTRTEGEEREYSPPT